MSAKQDRQGVRHAKDIEQKYDLSTNESVMSAAANAQRTATAARNTAESASRTAEEANTVATEAKEAVDTLDEALNQEEVINRLTGGTGIISSADGTVQIDLVNNKITVNALIINGKTVSWKANDDGTYTLIGS